MKLTSLGSVESLILGAFTFVVGQVVAFVPSLSSDQQVLISAGSAVIGAVFLAANAIHRLAESKTTIPVVADEHKLETAVRSVLAKVVAQEPTSVAPVTTQNPLRPRTQ